ncbi:hypothetical protein D6D20_04546 [Aureobasidium pullulans]|uniref:Uncharacterized protein n=1 Tax=Aureobasidium pullulans TaxID=5580 RepID=A0A4S8Z950_AURPU|nr:hypothetical protein D6D20_04546 [Aureobasidium pullulans]
MHGAFEIHVFNQRAIDRTLATSPDDAHLKASKYMESGGFTRHGMFTAIIVCRVLPTPHGKTELDGVKASLLQQQRFLEAMIPPHANEVSAYKDELSTLMRDRLVKIPTKAMVLTVSMDRASRSAETNEQFSKINEEAGHMFMSFLWSDAALLPGADALHIPPSSVDFNLIATDDMLEEQRCRSTTIKNLPVVKPVIWIPCSSSINDVIKATLHAAENYSRSCGTRFQTEPLLLILDKLKKPPDKMLDKAHIEQWNEFLQERIPILPEVTRAGKHTCSCVEKGHDSTCVYSCAKCVSYFDCVVIAKRKPSSIVPFPNAFLQLQAFAKWNDFVTVTEISIAAYWKETAAARYLSRTSSILSNKSSPTSESLRSSKRICPNVVHSTRLYGSFCSEVCKKQSAGVATALQTLYFRICARMGCHTRIPRSSNYNKFCSSSCLYDTKKGLQSLPPVLAARDLSSKHNENKVCAHSLCNVETIDQSICCSKVCRLQSEDEPYFQRSAMSTLIPTLKLGDLGFRECQLDSYDIRDLLLLAMETTSAATPDLEQKPRSALSSKANVPGHRECVNPLCDSHSPLGVKYGRCCSKKEVNVDAESKRVTNTSDLVPPCTRISCSSTKVQAGIWGSC